MSYRDEKYTEYVPDVPMTGGLLGSVAAQQHMMNRILHGNDYKTRPVTRTREVVCGANSSVEQPFHTLQLTITPKPTFENLNWWIGHVVLFLSKVEMRFFYSIVRQREKNWDEREPAEEVKWKTLGASLKLRDEVSGVTTSILDSMCHRIKEHLKNHYSVSKGSSESSTEPEESDLPEETRSEDESDG